MVFSLILILVVLFVAAPRIILLLLKQKRARRNPVGEAFSPTYTHFTSNRAVLILRHGRRFFVAVRK